MLQRWLFLLVCLFTLPSAVLAKDAYLSMVYTNAMDKELPFAIFSKGDWQPDPQARFVKLHMYFDSPIMVKGLEIDTCGQAIKPNISVFFNFDQWILRLDPKLGGEIPEAMYPNAGENGRLTFEGFDNDIEVRSLTFNFENNKNFRICGINLKAPDGEVYRIKPPKVVQGSVSATSVLSPETAYAPIYLFDSRFEYGWASNKQATDVGLRFHFNEPRRIEKLRIWNGYQRSIKHCYSNSRARKIHLSGDNGYAADIEVRDVLGSQVIDLPKPFTGKELRFDVVDSYLGKSYKDLVISELRFFDGQDWFLIDPTSQMRKNIDQNRQRFAQAGALALLNDSYEGTADSAKVLTQARLRLRADGSFYLSGSTEEEGVADFFSLGNYEIKQADAKNGLKLRLFGLYYETEVYGDCNGCGRDCNKNDMPEGVLNQQIFQEVMTIRPSPNGTYEVENLSGGKKIKFDRLTLKQETEE